LEVTIAIQIDPLELLRFDDLLELRIINDRKTLIRWMNRTQDPFPQPKKLSERTTAWRRTDIEAWLSRQPTVTIS